MENNTQDTFENFNGQYLNGPFSFNNELKKFNCLYFILGLIGFLIDGETHILGLIGGLMASFLIIAIISPFKVGTLRTMIFSLPESNNITYKELADIITMPLSKINMTVELLSDALRISHKGMEYDVTLLPEQCAFKIWPQKSFVRRLASKLYTGLYKKSIYAVPIIAYTIQNKFKESYSDENSENNSDEKILSAVKNMNLYFKNSFISVIACIGIISITVVLSLIFTEHSGNNHYINIIKDGNLNGYYVQSVGTAFDDFFLDENWEYFQSEDGLDVVEFNGTCLKDNQDCNVCVQFVINSSDDSFEVQYYSIDDIPQDLITWSYMLDKIYENL